jgi:hypothetical protein
VAKVRQMGDGPPEGRQSELEERDENFTHAANFGSAASCRVLTCVQTSST